MNNPHLPYTAPFFIFLGFLFVQPYLAPLGVWEYPLRVLLMAGVIWYFSREVLSFRLVAPMASVAIGIAVFVIWVGPDVLIPGYRQHPIFAKLASGGTPDPNLITNPMAQFFRTARAVIIVPIVEELFWRAWLMRWLIKPDFWTVPMGAYALNAFLITAALFASEHGSYWDVGLICGFIYNWWMVRTKSLGDLILTHAVTNLALSIYTIATQKWEYWL